MNRTRMLETYRAGYSAVADAVAGVSETDLDRKPDPDEWSAREVIHHMADSETHAYIRLRRLIAEEAPAIVGYDGDAYARLLHYDRPIAASLELVRTVREASLQLLEHLSPDQWDRSGTHSESGIYAVDDWLRIYSSHPYEHAEQIRAAIGS